MANDISLPPLHKLIMAYARASQKRGLELIFAMDNRFGEVVRSTTEPLIGQMKLTWWSDAIEKPTSERPSGEPLIAEMALHGHLFEDSMLWDELIAGWSILLDTGELDQSLMERYAKERGGALFKLAALNSEHEVTENLANLGKAWALWDLARNVSDAKTADLAFKLAQNHWKSGHSAKLNRRMRPISIIRKLIGEDIRQQDFEHHLHSPRTAFLIISHGLLGI